MSSSLDHVKSPIRGKWEQYRSLRSSVRINDFAPLIPGDPTTYHYDEDCNIRL